MLYSSGMKRPPRAPSGTLRPRRDVQRVNVDFPVGILEAIDREAQRLGVTRQAWIKLRCADALAATRLDVVGTTGGKATIATRSDR
jgi:hypothetical protein